MIDKISATRTAAVYPLPESAKDDPEQKSVGTGDSLDTGSTQSSGIYSKSSGTKIDPALVNSIKEQARKASEQLKTYVVKALLSQSNGETFKPDPDTVSWAKNAISEDGDWGVKAVSDRIVAFAKAISGNDKSKIDLLKSAIEKGFNEVSSGFGGSLPDICNQTHDEIMKKLDNWVNEKDDATQQS